MEQRSSAVQNAAALVNLPPLLDEFGVSLGAVLTGTGLSANDLQPGRFIPYAAFMEVLDRAAVLTDCDSIGLQLGLRHGLAAMGPLGVAMRSAATLGEALADFAAFQITNSTGAAVYLHRADGEVMLGYGVYDRAHAASRHVYDAVLAAGTVLLSELTKGAVRPTEFEFIRTAPRDTLPWQSLGAPIRFGQARSCIFLSRAALSFPLPTADLQARTQALADISRRLGTAPWGWTGRTRHAIFALMLDGRSKMPDVARFLDVHPRSLRRELARDGTTFETIKDDVRHAVSRELLSLTSLPVGEIAETLDFATPNAFNRAFRRWSGASPTAWRDRQRSAVYSEELPKPHSTDGTC